MFKLSLFLCLVVFGSSLLHLVKSNENQTCEIANSFSRTSPPNDDVHVHCDSDKSCAGFHCQGVYLVDNEEMHIKKGDPVCFGAIINHCDTPLSMDVYFDSVFMNTSFQRRLHHNASIQIPDFTLKSDLIDADLFIFVEMAHKDNKVTFALTGKVRFTVGQLEHWPEGLKYKMIPEQTFAVPPCLPGESRNVTPIPNFDSCVPPTSVAPSATVKPKSATYGKPCDPGNLYQCGENEMCTFSKKCDCANGMVINPISGLCDLPGASPTPKPKLNPVATTTIKSTTVTHSSSSIGAAEPHKAAEKPKKSSSGLITGLAVSAVAVLGIVILVSFLVWRSRGSSQFDHVPIVDSEDVVI